MYIIIELFSLALTVETFRHKSVDVSDFWREGCGGHFDRPLKVEGDVAHQPLLGGRRLEGLPFHVV